MLFFALLHSVDFYCLPCAFRVPCAVSPGYQQQSHRGNPNKKWRSCHLPRDLGILGQLGEFHHSLPFLVALVWCPPMSMVQAGNSRILVERHQAVPSGETQVDSVNMKNLKSHAIAPCQPSVKLAQGLLFHFSKGGYSQALDAEDFGKCCCQCLI